MFKVFLKSFDVLGLRRGSAPASPCPASRLLRGRHRGPGRPLGCSPPRLSLRPLAEGVSRLPGGTSPTPTCGGTVGHPSAQVVGAGALRGKSPHLGARHNPVPIPRPTGGPWKLIHFRGSAQLGSWPSRPIASTARRGEKRS